MCHWFVVFLICRGDFMNGYIMYLLNKLVSAFMTENADKSSCYYEENYIVSNNRKLKVTFELKEIPSMQLDEIGFMFNERKER